MPETVINAESLKTCEVLAPPSLDGVAPPSFDAHRLGFVSRSQQMNKILATVAQVARAETSVFISGESGTGKERVAQLIHHLSARCHGPFVTVNCGAIPENLVESELFGHVKGSFTGAIQSRIGLFEQANGGTVFLDEIGDMNLALQVKLLRVLQERRIRPIGQNQDKAIDVRVISATHRNLKERITQGTFREDLYYRLTVIPIQIPPLRSRPDDIEALALYFLKKHAAANSSRAQNLSPLALAKLQKQSWHGNVRELENVIERAVVMANTDILDESDLCFERDEIDETKQFSLVEQSASLPLLEDLENEYIKFVLSKTGGKKEVTSKILGINRRTLYRKERELNH